MRSDSLWSLQDSSTYITICLFSFFYSLRSTLNLCNNCTSLPPLPLLFIASILSPSPPVLCILRVQELVTNSLPLNRQPKNGILLSVLLNCHTWKYFTFFTSIFGIVLMCRFYSFTREQIVPHRSWLISSKSCSQWGAEMEFEENLSNKSTMFFLLQPAVSSHALLSLKWS